MESPTALGHVAMTIVNLLVAWELWNGQGSIHYQTVLTAGFLIIPTVTFEIEIVHWRMH
jgi:hypothetical protein